MGRDAVSLSAWRLRYDLFTVHALLRAAQAFSAGSQPRPEIHLFLADRYERLSIVHQRRGNSVRARELADKAEWHYAEGGFDDPPRAAAMGMPRPRPPVFTDARARSTKSHPDDAA